MSSNRKVPPAEPFYIKIHAQDNVAIIANTNGLPTDTRFPCGLILAEHVPQGHKVALVDIAAGQPVLRYNATIGYALRDIPMVSTDSKRTRSGCNEMDLAIVELAAPAGFCNQACFLTDVNWTKRGREH